jgi:hypothetical protein
VGGWVWGGIGSLSQGLHLGNSCCTSRRPPATPLMCRYESQVLALRLESSAATAFFGSAR